ncbi:AP2 domain-containing protein [Secundilactobacillus mixtipabuli]|uniref:Uncharacterized protein n=1 Tax=Secundilactobacillus mixtipabuli TaxID=1435342 RepID=A0A1Z5I8I4_9LACO|nr:AP2 domain-containing protein [Secundilactobacillus mixtipabuli]GAW98093.1 hypothetical protein IWT30_00036 [Secundilactobacillus mixtipabuli]
MSKRIDLTNQRFGRLVVTKYYGNNAANSNAMWLCQCDCGNKTVVDGVRLRSGITKSCGCLRRDLSSKRVYKNPKFVDYMGRSDQLRDENGVSLSSISESARNKSGVIGVSYDRQTGKWFARLMIDHKYVLLKSFKTITEAIEARREAEETYLGIKRETKRVYKAEEPEKV